MNYPHAPGHKATDTDTSERAAISIATTAKDLRDQVEQAYKLARSGMTHDRCAEALWTSGGGLLNTAAFERYKRSVRSRASELKAAGKIEPLPERERNVSGHSAVVWRHVMFAPPKIEHRVQGDLL